MNDVGNPPPPLPAQIAPAEPAPARTSTILAQRPGLFGDVFVVFEDGLHLLRFGSVDAADQSGLDPRSPDALVFEYIRLTAIAPAVRPHGRPLRRALALGLGGGAWPRLLLATQPQVHVDAVEIDPVVVDLARSFFALPTSPRLHIVVDDAARFVERPEVKARRYDLIFLDAFSADTMPAALSTPAFLRGLRRLLADDGVLLVNVALADRPTADAVIGRLAELFPGCSHVRARTEENQVVFAGKRPLPPDHLQRAVARASLELGFEIGRDVGGITPCPTNERGPTPPSR